jgi:hypothetical protein
MGQSPDVRELIWIRFFIMIQLGISVCNLLAIVVFLGVVMSYGFKITDDVKVYWDENNVTGATQQSFDIISNVRTISKNMVPVSEVTSQAVTDASNMTGNVSFAQAATDALVGAGQANWDAVLGNATVAMGSFGNINFSAVTGLFEQAQNPQTQAVVKEQIEHFFKSFDFTSKGISGIFKVIKEGILSER